MAKLIYIALTSLDLYLADESGNFDWAAPDGGRPLLRQRPHAADRHPPLRPTDVRRARRLAAQALRPGLVDEIHLFLNPLIVGGGNAAVPDGKREPLELIDEHRFAGGAIHVAYVVAS